MDLLHLFCLLKGLSAHTHVELPYYSKFLLIAAYLASYNPARTDKRFFLKVKEYNNNNTFFMFSHVYTVMQKILIMRSAQVQSLQWVKSSFFLYSWLCDVSENEYPKYAHLWEKNTFIKLFWGGFFVFLTFSPKSWFCEWIKWITSSVSAQQHHGKIRKTNFLKKNEKVIILT